MAARPQDGGTGKWVTVKTKDDRKQKSKPKTDQPLPSQTLANRAFAEIDRYC